MPRGMADSKEEAAAYLKEVDVRSVLGHALNAAVQAKAREPISFFAGYFAGDVGSPVFDHPDGDAFAVGALDLSCAAVPAWVGAVAKVLRRWREV